MFLDKQSALFVETADSLFTIAKERLRNARYVLMLDKIVVHPLNFITVDRTSSQILCFFFIG